MDSLSELRVGLNPFAEIPFVLNQRRTLRLTRHKPVRITKVTVISLPGTADINLAPVAFDIYYSCRSHIQ